MTATSSRATEYLAAPNRVASAANGIDYAYREVGEGSPALVLLQHFRGNLDNWDPALVDALARGRRVGRRAPPGARLRGPARRRRDARLGARGDRSRRRAAPDPDGYLGVFFTASASASATAVDAANRSMLWWARWLIPSESAEALSTDRQGDLLHRGDPGGRVTRPVAPITAVVTARA